MPLDIACQLWFWICYHEGPRKPRKSGSEQDTSDSMLM
jgi:hypothetical protein